MRRTLQQWCCYRQPVIRKVFTNTGVPSGDDRCYTQESSCFGQGLERHPFAKRSGAKDTAESPVTVRGVGHAAKAHRQAA
ncbi:MAG: hypothetical protein QM727_04585 [Niabella sp.]